MKILILYHTKTGHILEAADAVAEGIRSAGSDVDLIPVRDFDPGQLADYDALIVASPCWGGSITPSGVAFPILQALNGLGPDALGDAKCAGISVHSGTGGETTIRTIGEILTRKGCQAYTPGPVARAGIPFSLWKGPSVPPEDEARFVAFGREFAT